ncbi:DNA-3-methyladenine glycosylase I [Sporolactobacillus pectinivorans]|uniref:DNA-3-methyladenine glycosylase I n=1 Tax=Sporolactobacillus pectinivorans TaxID=1591408 RepID=UPI000C258A13|nr:DNA-3-methyladenine glycosylase I [Sporolactobacillus pectinivorans]
MDKSNENINLRRCNWNTTDPVYLAYHDTEWGRPQRDSKTLFEMLCLEGMQAGLSWITILKRRENYRKAFAGFNPEKIALFSEEQQEQLMNNAGIIRNRRKIQAIVVNARAYLEVEKEKPFSDYIWSFTGGQPMMHHYSSHDKIPAFTDESKTMSKDLKKRGFKFVGETICYAFMQAVGIVNDHETSCFCYEPISKMI